MSLPSSRNTTYAPGSQVLSADLNAIQDGVVNLYAGYHQQITIQIPAVLGSAQDSTASWAKPPGSAYISYNTGGADDVWHVPIVLRQGQRIKACRGYVRDNSGSGGTVVTMTLRKGKTTGTESSIGSPAASSGAGADQTLTIGSLTEVVGAGESFYLTFAADKAQTCRVYMIEVDVDAVP